MRGLDPIIPEDQSLNADTLWGAESEIMENPPVSLPSLTDSIQAPWSSLK